MAKALLFLWVFLLIFPAQAAKKTVCSLTINSDDEITVFKKFLSPKEFNFVELADLIPPEEKYREEVTKHICRPEINCDVLIVSGHFGGMFFGSSGIYMQLEDMEENSCLKSCNGIFKAPKEVYLFGCNTLADKEKDHRTPEEYFEVLAQDFNPEQAQMIAALRYSDLGDSFRSRMENLFDNTKSIIGFSSTSWPGDKMRPKITRYLKALTEQHGSYGKYLNKLSTQKNDDELLKKYIRGAVVQTKGTLKKEHPYCLLSDKDISRAEKINWIDKSIRRDDRLSNIPYIERFIGKEIQNNNSSITIKPDKKSQAELEKLTKVKGNAYVSMRLRILELLKNLGWINPQEYADRLPYTLEFDTAVSAEKKNLICRQKLAVEIIPVDTVAESQWTNIHFLETLACLKPKNEDIKFMLTKALFNTNDEKVHAKILEALKELKPTDAEQIKEVIAFLLSSKSEQAQLSAVSVLAKAPINLNMQIFLVDLLANSSDDNNLPYYAFTILKSIPLATETIDAIHTVWKTSKKSSIRSYAAQILRSPLK
jgi:hypothetical protein